MSRFVTLLTIALFVSGLTVQTNADMFGPPDSSSVCSSPQPGTSPAVFDVNGNGPDASDEPVYLTPTVTPGEYTLVSPFTSCAGPQTITLSGSPIDTISFTRSDGTDSYSQNAPTPLSDTNQRRGGGGGIACTKGDEVASGVAVEEDGEEVGVRLVAANNVDMEVDWVCTDDFNVELVGWSSSPFGTGTGDYITMPLGGLGLIKTCGGVDETVRLWIPVEGGSIVPDLDCDGVADGGFVELPTFTPNVVVPVELMSFEVAQRLLENPIRIAMSFVLGGGLFLGLAFVRTR